MSIDNTQVLSASRAYVWTAAPGTAAPETSVADMTAQTGWTNVGLTTPDSLSFSTEPEFEELPAHQSDHPVRRLQTSDSASVAVDLMQWNENNLKLAFGGGTITEPDDVTNPGEYKFVPPALGARPEVSVIIDVVDGTKRYRWVFPRTMQIEGVEAEFQKGQGANLPLRLAVMGDDASDPWYLLTNDPAYAPPA